MVCGGRRGCCGISYVMASECPGECGGLIGCPDMVFGLLGLAKRTISETQDSIVSVARKKLCRNQESDLGRHHLFEISSHDLDLVSRFSVFDSKLGRFPRGGLLGCGSIDL